MVIYLELPEFLSQWLRHELWNPTAQAVEFPRGSAERNVLELYLAKQPPNSVPQLAEPRLTPVLLPNFVQKDTRTYNYLPPKATELLQKTIYKRFQITIWNEMQQVCPEVNITNRIYAWMENKGIEVKESNWEAIRQLYYRMRKKYEKKSPSSRGKSH